MKIRTISWGCALLCALGEESVANAGEFPFLTEVDIAIDDTLLGGDVDLVDLDGDGDLDLLVEAGRLSWFENENGFTGSNEQRLVDASLTSERACIADVDGDGDPDLVSSGRGLQWYENEEQARIWTAHPIDDLDGYDGYVAAGDADADGDVDVFHVLEAELRWFRNDGDSFAAALPVNSSLFGVGPIAGADVDADGDYDLFAEDVDANDPTVYLLRNEGGALQWSEAPFLMPSDLKELDVVDRDGDGDLDVLVGLDAHAMLLENLDGSFALDQIADSTPVVRAWTLDVADVEGDGSHDLIAVTHDPFVDGEGIVWFDDDLQTHRVVAEWSEPGGVAAGDIDCDGDGDFVTIGQAESFDFELRVFVNETNAPKPDECLSPDGGDESTGSGESTGGEESGDDTGDESTSEPPTDGTTTTGGDASGDAEPAQDGGGRGCTVGGHAPALPLLLLVTFAAVLRRRTP